MVAVLPVRGHSAPLTFSFVSPLAQITFKNAVGQYDLEVTTFQLAVLFAWNQRPRERISFENLKLATELPDAELRRTLWVRYKCFISIHQLHYVLVKLKST